jgi:hypothetical protein
MYRPLFYLLPTPPPRKCPVLDCDRVAGDGRYQCERCDILDSMIAALDAMNKETHVDPR